MNSPSDQSDSNKSTPPLVPPLVIAHRGASGYLPEHTLAAYSLAIWQGADFIEPDLVMTRDGALIARHDNQLDLTTNVSEHPEFKTRRTEKEIDGQHIEGWFSEDFTLAEIKTLKAIERIPDTRPKNTRFNGQFDIPTFDEIIQLVRNLEPLVGRPVGLYPETKHPTHFSRNDLDINTALLQTLNDQDWLKPGKLYIQSFEVGNLKDLKRQIDVPLVQLLLPEGQPEDQKKPDGIDYRHMASKSGLADIRQYADALGPHKSQLLTYTNNGPAPTSSLLEDAKQSGLALHPYTFRAEPEFLPPTLNQLDHSGLGQMETEISWFLQAGIHGFFTDHPDIGVWAKQQFLQNEF